MRFVLASVVVVALAVVVLAVVANLPAAGPPRPPTSDLPDTLAQIDRQYRELFAPMESEHVARKVSSRQRQGEYLALRERYREAMRDAHRNAGQAVPIHLRDWESYTPSAIEQAFRRPADQDSGSKDKKTAD